MSPPKCVPKFHAPLLTEAHPQGVIHKTLCGESLRHDRIRSDRAQVTCRACLARLCRYVVTHEIGGVRKVLLATDNLVEAQERLEEAVHGHLMNVLIGDQHG